MHKFCIHLFLINYLVNYYIFHQRFLYFLEVFNSEFPYIEVWFSDQNYKHLGIKEKVKIDLVIN